MQIYAKYSLDICINAMYNSAIIRRQTGGETLK